ncbi:hypothetical protein A2U01_0112250, partial [Trifolium medium]|nr:hypothetical protein [Trifolium medium]
MEAGFKELPINVVKGFFKVEFESYKAFLLLLRFSHKVDDFLQDNRVVRCASSWQEAAL